MAALAAPAFCMDLLDNPTDGNLAYHFAFGRAPALPLTSAFPITR
ncbi:hypothetical protein GWL_26750 [Herbaspirillum sp. GW103]|nr:hypothetical protein GWL_26750 [Herbaspirillum sp. GW103]